MTAEEMFEELGFEKIEHTKSYIRYGIEKYYNDHIDFDIKNKMFRISTITGSGYRNPVYVKYELHKAITKQMEELGWI